MQLENVLRSVHSTADLPAVVAALGHQALHEALPSEAWNTPRQENFDVVAVGRSDDLPWFAIASNEPERDAVRLGHRISSRGKAGVVLALDATNRRLAVAAAFDRVPSLPIDLSRPDPGVLASLRRLAGSWGGGPLAYAARAAEALCGEPVGRRFFREFRSRWMLFRRSLPCPMGSEERRSLALLQLTRVLFLYFIQAKGWLGRPRPSSWPMRWTVAWRGSARSIATCCDRSSSARSTGRRGSEADSRPVWARSVSQRRSVRAPSAGAALRADIPNLLWRAAFDELFERFHFVVSEQAQAGGIAPDMLGRVFEGVMAPDARRASGTYYTPASLVRSIIDAALVALLAETHLQGRRG